MWMVARALSGQTICQSFIRAYNLPGLFHKLLLGVHKAIGASMYLGAEKLVQLLEVLNEMTHF